MTAIERKDRIVAAFFRVPKADQEATLRTLLLFVTERIELQALQHLDETNSALNSPMQAPDTAAAAGEGMTGCGGAAAAPVAPLGKNADLASMRVLSPPDAIHERLARLLARHRKPRPVRKEFQSGDVLTLEEVARHLSISMVTAERELRAGRFVRSLRIGILYRFRFEDVQAYATSFLDVKQMEPYLCKRGYIKHSRSDREMAMLAQKSIDAHCRHET